MTSQSNQALLVECQPRRLGSVPGCSAGAGRIRFVATAGESTLDSRPACPADTAPSTTSACNAILIDPVPVPGIADFEGSSPEIVSYAQRLGPNRSRSPLSYLRNVRSRGPLSVIQSTGGVLMRRTLVGLIAALALGSVSPAAFAADMVPSRRRSRAGQASISAPVVASAGPISTSIAGTACSTMMGSAIRDVRFPSRLQRVRSMATSSASCRAASIRSSAARLRRRSRG